MESIGIIHSDLSQSTETKIFTTEFEKVEFSMREYIEYSKVVRDLIKEDLCLKDLSDREIYNYIRSNLRRVYD